MVPTTSTESMCERLSYGLRLLRYPVDFGSPIVQTVSYRNTIKIQLYYLHCTKKDVVWDLDQIAICVCIPRQAHTMLTGHFSANNAIYNLYEPCCQGQPYTEISKWLPQKIRDISSFSTSS